MTDPPYPSSAASMLHDRVHRIEGRVDHQETIMTSLITNQAVTNEQVKDIKDDIRELIGRVSGILRAVWMLVLVLIPVAVSLISIALSK